MPPAEHDAELTRWVNIRRTLIGLGIFILGGFVIGYIYIQRVAIPDLMSDAQRLPKLTRLQNDLEATRQDGKAVRLGELQGDVFIIGALRTHGPDTGKQVVAQMKRIADAFAGEPRLHLVSIAVEPEADTAAVLADFANLEGLDLSKWWLLTGRTQELRGYLTRNVGLLPVRPKIASEQHGDDDTLYWDTHLALIDQAGHVRRYYDVLNRDPGLRDEFVRLLESDIRQLFEEGGDARTPAPGPKP